MYKQYCKLNAQNLALKKSLVEQAFAIPLKKIDKTISIDFN